MLRIRWHSSGAGGGGDERFGAGRLDIDGYEPSDRELNEQLKQIVKNGWKLGQRSIDANDAARVVDYVVTGWARRLLPSDLRVVLESALPLFLQWA